MDFVGKPLCFLKHINTNDAFLETENEKLKDQLKDQQDKNKALLEDINKNPVEVPTSISNSRTVFRIY